MNSETRGSSIAKGCYFLLILFVVAVFYIPANAQCINKVSLINTEKTSSGSNEGTIEVGVTSGGRYEAELYLITGSGKTLVQKKLGSGNENVLFSNLAGEDNYQVLVIFNSEQEDFCKKRQISEISTLIK